MTEQINAEELFKKNFPQFATESGVCLSPYWDLFSAGLEAGEPKWHYVNWKYFADEDYPESELALYLVRLRNKDVFICVWETVEGFGCFWDNNLEPIDNDDIYAWKKIVLPEEIKEND